ncbi:MAG: hypothetical protein U0232_00695 [Thermomicrobiales bacterium]
MQLRVDQEDPGDDADAGGEDGGVDQGGAILAASVAAEQQQHAEAEDSLPAQVEGVADRGEGDRDAANVLVVGPDQVAHDGEPVAEGEEIPGGAVGRAV